MKLCNETLEILKNYSEINMNLVIKSGKTIKCVSPSSDIMSVYNGEDVFDKSVSIYDMKRFLGVLSVFEEPDLVLSDKSVTIKGENRQVTYIYSEESLLSTVNTSVLSRIEALEYDNAEFILSDHNLSEINKVAKTLNLHDLSVIGDGEKVQIKLLDAKNPTSDNFNIDLNEECADIFSLNFKLERFKLWKGDYDVGVGIAISAKTQKKTYIARFKHSKVDITYYIALESNSTFE